MRKSRFTYKGAYHHVMARGVDGKDIFFDYKLREYFLKVLAEESGKYRIRILAYCIMDTHYHLIIQNSSGKMSDFMRQLNGNYGINYRVKNGGKGHIFQDRYKSTLIQKDNYLDMAVIYVLLNPVRAGIVSDPYKYRWSSINEYFIEERSDIVDNKLVEDLFWNRSKFTKLLEEWASKNLEVKNTRLGEVIGERDFIKESIKGFNRRKTKGKSRRMRKGDYIFEEADEVIKIFEKEKGLKMDKIKTNTLNGKELRSELLVLLKDRSGLKYKEIMEYPLFKSLKYSSLSQLYKRSRKRLEG
ncbi:transposase [candidate division WOR-3 bacterium]|nr:transposase [candidate division WOR-3 bacterium]